MPIFHAQRCTSITSATTPISWSNIVIPTVVILTLFLLCISLLRNDHASSSRVYSHFTQLLFFTQQIWSKIIGQKHGHNLIEFVKDRAEDSHPFDIDFSHDTYSTQPLPLEQTQHGRFNVAPVRSPTESGSIAIQLEKINARRAMRVSNTKRPRPTLMLRGIKRSPSPLGVRTPLLADGPRTLSPIPGTPADPQAIVMTHNVVD